jgi:hypothetical protein
VDFVSRSRKKTVQTDRHTSRRPWIWFQEAEKRPLESTRCSYALEARGIFNFPQVVV